MKGGTLLGYLLLIGLGVVLFILFRKGNPLKGGFSLGFGGGGNDFPHAGEIAQALARSLETDVVGVCESRTRATGRHLDVPKPRNAFEITFRLDGEPTRTFRFTWAPTVDAKAKMKEVWAAVQATPPATDVQVTDLLVPLGAEDVSPGVLEAAPPAAELPDASDAAPQGDADTSGADE